MDMEGITGESTGEQSGTESYGKKSGKESSGKKDAAKESSEGKQQPGKDELQL
jgi:hypothetical protein